MSNPVLNDTYWTKLKDADHSAPTPTTMTAQGAITKTCVLLALLMATVGWMWSAFWNDGQLDPARFMPFVIGGAITGLVAVLINMFVPRFAMFTGGIYAIAEGLVLGGVTMIVHLQYPGLPLLAACFTTATLLAMLLLYRTGIIKASPAFVRGIIGATVGLALGVAALWILNMFHIGTGVSAMLYGNGTIGIGFSVICVALAALNLVLDFAFIENGSRQGLPKYMEWVGALGLMVTLVWLYIEILRLLAKLRSRD